MAQEVAQKSGVGERKVREDFIHLINEKIQQTEHRGEIIGKRYGESDDWLLVTHSLDLVFKIITYILDHNTQYKHYERVPLEIGIGLGQYDEYANLHGSKLTAENSTIEFLKTNIIEHYREWYKRSYSKSIKSTFVVLTDSVFNEMEPLDREICRKVEFESTKSLFAIEMEKIIKRGKVLNFLETIKKSANPWYRRIERTFVPPNEYKSIIDCLEKNKIIFLIGDPEIGKTYTAVRLMWEYYCKGYNPIWFYGAESDERKKSRQIMSECTIEDNSIVYFEDPFGRTIFEDREELRRTIGNFLNKIKDLNARVIVTSREEVFKEFVKEKLSQSDLLALTVEMRLMKPSYNKDKMEEILLNWASEFDCKWLAREDLKSSVIGEAGKKLLTPLSLRDFALDSKDSDDLNVIVSKIREKSKEVKEAFAEEIIKMNKEKQTFLSLVYILHLLKTEDIKAIYDKKCLKFGLDLEANPFEYMIEHFKSKIARDREDIGYEFTHPSYEEGLVLSWNKIGVKTFFLKIVDELTKDDKPFVRGLCGFCLTKDFAEISFKDEARSLIGAVLRDKNPNARNGVAEATRYYFNNIPSNLALNNLQIMSNDRNRFIRATAVGVIRDNLKKFPMQESLRFISKGLDDRAAWVRLETVGVVRGNMKDFPEEIVLKALERCEELCHYSGWLISFFAGITYHDFKKAVHDSIHADRRE